MQHLFDLDVLAERLAVAARTWLRTEGVKVAPLTWRDETASWPQPILEDRSAVVVPESLGLRVRREPHDELEVVVWVGGWADVNCLKDWVITAPHAEFHDADSAYAAVVRVVEDFLTLLPDALSASPSGRSSARIGFGGANEKTALPRSSMT